MKINGHEIYNCTDILPHNDNILKDLICNDGLKVCKRCGKFEADLLLKECVNKVKELTE